MFHTTLFRLAVLTLFHFTVDFYAGLVVPLVEPTLTTHLNASLTAVALLVGGTALFINVVQPLGGWLLPKRGLPLLLVLTPPTAAAISLLGVSNLFPVVTLIFLVGGLGIGLAHPEAALTASAISGRREGLGMGLFLSGGYFGFACGSLVSGIWVERSGVEALGHFWILGVPAILVVFLVVLAGLHRFHASEAHADTRIPGYLPFTLTWPVCILTASFNLLFFRLVTLYLVRTFPGQDPQAWGGTVVFTFGVSGAIAASFWGGVSARTTSGRLIAILVLAGAPFYWLLLRIDTPRAAVLWSLLAGVTLGATFPLTVVLARRSRGSAHRLRLGLAIGGAWGCGEALYMVAGAYIDRFPSDHAQPVVAVMNLLWVLLAVLLVFALLIDRLERAHARLPAH